MINKIDNLLVRLSWKKERKKLLVSGLREVTLLQILQMLKRAKREHEQLYVYKYNNLIKMDTVF